MSLSPYATTCKFCGKPLVTEADQTGLDAAGKAGDWVRKLAAGLSHNHCADWVERRGRAVEMMEHCCTQLARFRANLSPRDLATIRTLLEGATVSYGKVLAEIYGLPRPFFSDSLVNDLILRPLDIAKLLRTYRDLLRGLAPRKQAAIETTNQKLLL